MTISGGSALPKEEIERMVKDAEAHAEEDKKRREETETRNTAEQLVYSTEKFLTDSGDQVPEDLRGTVDTALNDLKEALKPESEATPEDIKAKMETLSTESQKMGTAMYAAQAEGAEGAGAGFPGGDGAGFPGGEGFPGTDGAAAGEQSAADDVVDAEVVDDEESK